jgi:VIT1/CCC1 family predicted Fe2+/Mn2+ transporter
MDEATRSRLLRLQRMEATEAAVYRRLAARQKNEANRAILSEIAGDEERHESILAEMTGEQVKPQSWKVSYHNLLAMFLGLTFAVRLMERTEHGAAAEYRALGMDELADEEDAHEARLIGMLEEKRLDFSGSIVLGMSDALIEMTGVLAGLTFALQSMKLVALAGLVTGIAASFSMGASEFLSKKAEEEEGSAKTAALYTWAAYLATVLLLVCPYLLISADGPLVYGFETHIQALFCTFVIGFVIVAVFNYYISVVDEKSFKHRFGEMSAILIAVILISFGIGVLLRGWLGVEV